VGVCDWVVEVKLACVVKVGGAADGVAAAVALAVGEAIGVGGMALGVPDCKGEVAAGRVEGVEESRNSALGELVLAVGL
jgi:hypothetical protein